MGDGKGSLINIEDALGIGQGIVKLIDVVSEGMGKLYEPKHLTRLADAKAYEIGTIANAMESKGLINYTFVYEDNKITFKSEEGKQLELPDRAIQRMISLEIKKQINTEKIINIAAEELKDVDSVLEEKVDEDWITRFFSIAEEVSSEQMQYIWGKILAGEVKQPNSFSLRTLEFVKNLPKDEAQLISTIAKAAFKVDDQYLIVRDKDFLLKEFDVSFFDILVLQQIGFLKDGLGFVMNEEILTYETKLWFRYANVFLEVVISPGTRSTSVPIYHISRTGNEILSIIDVDLNNNVIENFTSKIKKDGVKIFYGENYKQGNKIGSKIIREL